MRSEKDLAGGERSRMIRRLGNLYGSRTNAPNGMEIVLREHGLEIPSKNAFIFYRCLPDEKLRELLRDNERHIRYEDIRPISKEEARAELLSIESEGNANNTTLIRHFFKKIFGEEA